MRKVLATIALFCSGCFGQAPPLNPNQQIFASVSTTGPSAVVQNNGAAEHTFLYNFVNAPAQNCAAAIAGGAWSVFQFQGSGDGNTWFPLTSMYTSAVSGNAAAATSGLFTAYGAYPYVRVNVLIFGNSTACRLNGWYSGSLFPASPNDVNFQSTGLASGTTTASSSGDNLLLTTNPSNGQTFSLSEVLYGLAIYNGAAANTVNLYCKTASGGAINATLLTLTAFTGAYILPASIRGYFSCPVQNQIYVNLGNSTAVNVYALYRFE
jgi:hypothetical protein